MKLALMGWMRLIPSYAVVGLMTWAIAPTSAIAQVTPDLSLGAEHSIVTGTGTSTIGGGAARGANLFHSFSVFNVRNGEGVYFANPAGIDRIFSRVTGNTRSEILGTLGVLGNADLWLLNPNGILFGPNARLDIRGSFVGTTASSIQFPNGSEFSAIRPQPAPLLTINLTPGLQYGASRLGATIINHGSLVTGKDLTLSADNLDLQGYLHAGRDLTLQASDRVQIRDTPTQPLIAIADRTLLIQGNQGIDIFALHQPDSGLYAGAGMRFRSNATVQGDAHFWTGGSFQIERLDGSLGNLYSPNDPIIRSQGDVNFFGYAGASLHILAGGQVNIDTIFITGPDTIAATINPTATPTLANITLSDGTPLTINGNTQATVDIRAGMAPAAIGTPLGTSGGGSGVFFNAIGFPIANPGNNPARTSANITIGNISTDATVTNGLVFLTNRFQADSSLPGGTITLLGTGFSGTGIDTTSVAGNGGAVILDARQDINLRGFIATSSVSPAVNVLAPGNGGNVTLLANTGIITSPAAFVDASGVAGGTITLKTNGAISLTADLFSISDRVDDAKSGAILIRADSLSVTNGAQVVTLTNNNGTGGDVAVETRDFVRLSGVSASGPPSQLGTLTQGTGAAGNLSLTTRHLIVEGGAQVALNSGGAGPGGNLTVKADTIDLSGTNPAGTFASGLGANAASTGNAGTVNITTGQLTVRDGAQIGVGTIAAGNGGTLEISATDFVKVVGQGPRLTPSGLFSLAATGSSGNAGSLKIQTGQLIVQGRSQLSASTNGSGNGGTLEITANQVKIQGGASVSANTSGPGKGGTITVNAAESVEVSGKAPNGTISLLSGRTSGTGNAGSLAIATKRLTIQDGGQVESSTFNQGQGGALRVTASERVEVIGGATDIQSSTGLFATAVSGSGNGGTLQIDTRQLVLSQGGQIGAGTFGAGNGGTIEINASDLVQVTGKGPGAPSGLFSSANLGSTGKAGDINVTTGQLIVRDQALISAKTDSPEIGGNITVNANTVTLTSGGMLKTTTTALGQAGNIRVKTSDRVTLANNGSGFFANTDPGSTGKGGTISVNSPGLTLSDRARISVDSQGSGEGGNIQVQANSLSLDTKAAISAQTASNTGGDISLSVQDLVLLRRGSSISTTAGTAQGNGDGGNIRIKAGFIVAVPFENSDITANAFKGRGGNINIDTQGIFGIAFRPALTPFSDITASSQFGLAGTVAINTLGIDPVQGTVNLPTTFSQPPLAQGCRATSRTGSFKNIGQGGIPVNPVDPTVADAIWQDVEPLEKRSESGKRSGSGEIRKQEQSTIPDSQSSIVEAQGWVVLPDGRIILTAEASTGTPHAIASPTVDCSSSMIHHP
jgi:filamentous hemagglutinin family protein